MSHKTNGIGYGSEKPMAIYYEHPDWFRPLFEQLDERGVPWQKIDARHHSYDVRSPEQEYSLLFNRMSPSAWQRGLGHGIFYTLNYLAHLEGQGVRVVNGYRSFHHEISKALQLTNLEKLGLPYPQARVINHPRETLAAAQDALRARDVTSAGGGGRGGKFLYAIQIHISGESYNLCPADICQNPRGEEVTRPPCPGDPAKSGRKVEGYGPPRQVIQDVE